MSVAPSRFIPTPCNNLVGSGVKPSTPFYSDSPGLPPPAHSVVAGTLPSATVEGSGEGEEEEGSERAILVPQPRLRSGHRFHKETNMVSLY